MIDGAVLVIGGISGRFNLEMLNVVPRSHFKTLQGVPPELWQGQDSDDGLIKHHDWQCIMGAALVRPGRGDERLGGQHAARRGRDVGRRPHARVAARAQPTHIIRSHEWVEQGYDNLHNGQVMTLFSASNYYSGELNMGAYLRMSSDPAKPSFDLYQYVTEDGKEAAAGSWRDHVGQCEEAAIERASIVLFEHKSKMLAAFAEIDKSKSGQLTLSQWAAAMAKAIPIKLPWLHLRGFFVSELEGGKVDYNEFLDGLEVMGGVDEAKQVPIPEHVYRFLPELEQMFRMMNTDGTGHLTREQFNDMVDALNKVVKTEAEWLTAADRELVLTSMDPQYKGDIRFVDFINRSSTSRSTARAMSSTPSSPRPKSPARRRGDRGRSGLAEPAAHEEGAPARLSRAIKAPSADGTKAADDLRSRRQSAVGKVRRRSASGTSCILTRCALLFCGSPKTSRPRFLRRVALPGKRSSSRTVRRRRRRSHEADAICRQPVRALPTSPPFESRVVVLRAIQARLLGCRPVRGSPGRGRRVRISHTHGDRRGRAPDTPSNGPVQASVPMRKEVASGARLDVLARPRVVRRVVLARLVRANMRGSARSYGAS